MKKILTRLSSILLLATIVVSAIFMSGHVFAQTESIEHSEPIIEREITTENSQLVDPLTDEEETKLNAQYDETVAEVISEPEEPVFSIATLDENNNEIPTAEETASSEETDDGTLSGESTDETESTSATVPAETIAPEQTDDQAAPSETESSTETQQPLREYCDETQKKLVAVIDTGVSHEYAAQRINFTDENGNDDNGHGTIMAKRIIEYSEDKGVILSLKAFTSDGKGTIGNVMKALQYAIDQHVDIINMSFSAIRDDENADKAAFEETVKTAMRNGIQVIASAGNNNDDIRFYIPAGIENVISVGAMDSNKVKRPFSNYGNVSYYEDAGSTSEAAAILTGKLAGGSNLSDEVTSKTIILSEIMSPDVDKVIDSNGFILDSTLVLEGIATYSGGGSWNGYTYTPKGSFVAYAPVPSGYSSSWYNCGGVSISSGGTNIQGKTFQTRESSSSSNVTRHVACSFGGGTASTPANVMDWLYGSQENSGTMWLHVANAEGVSGAINSGGELVNGWWNRANRRFTSAHILRWGGGNDWVTYSSTVGGRTNISYKFQKNPILYFDANGGSGSTNVAFNASNVEWQLVRSGNGYVVQWLSPNTGNKGPDCSYEGWSNYSGVIADPTRKGYTFAGWSISSGKIFSNTTLQAKWTANKYYLDLNGVIDGKDKGSLSHAKADIYIEGSKVSSGVTDYYAQHPYGTNYKIVVTPDTGYSVNKSVWEGTIGDSNVSVYPEITTNSYTLSMNPNGGTYKGSSNTTSVSVDYDTGQEVNEIPTRSGYSFVGWSRTGSGSLHSGNSSSRSSEITQTEKADSDGTAYTNYSMNCTNSSQGNMWPNMAFFSYNYESGHTYRISYDVRVNSVSGLGYAHIRHSAFGNNWEAIVDSINSTTSGWSHRTLERTFTGTTVTQNGTASSIRPIVEFYCAIAPGKTGQFNFDIKNMAVYDVTAGKYVSSTSVSVKNGATVDIGAGDTTLTAHWSANTYNVTYNANGGTGAPATQNFVYNSGAKISTTVPTRTGYTFVDWVHGSVHLKPGEAIPSRWGDFDLTANWTPNTYTVTYNSNGGSGSMTADTVAYNSAYKTKKNAFIRTGYTFTGWNEKADGTGSADWSLSATGVYESGKPWTWTYTHNITLYAQWKANSYTYNIKYVSSTGKALGSTTVTGSFDTATKVSAPSKTGYTTPATQDVKFDSINAKTITFTYVPVSYSIGYNLNGGTVTGNPTSYTVESPEITLKNPSKTGHTFLGWTGSNGDSAQTAVKIASGSTGNKSFTANWSVNNYYLDLNGTLDGSANGGITGYGTADVYVNGVLKGNDVSDFYQEIPYGSSYEIKDIKATAGHVYAGTDQVLKGTMGTSRINISLKFNTKKTVVNFMRNYNSSDAAKSSETYTYGVSNQSFSNRGYSRTGYTLLGWAESQTATKETYPVNCGVASSWIDGHYPSINLYAVWSKNTYKISYNLNGGSVSGNPETYHVDTADIALKNPSRTGYTFLGWSGTGIIGTSKEVKIPKGSTENRSYTANWKINQYDIVIKGDRGTESITYGGKTYPLTATKSVTIHADYGANTDVKYTVKKGFHIVNETGTSMSNTQQTWTNNAGKEGSAGGQSWTTCAFTRTITVNTAQNKFVLSFGDGNGGTSGSQNATFGNGEKVTFNAAKKPGYTFKNWNTKIDGTGKSYPDGVSIDKIDAANGSTITLYPIYRPNVLTFHFYANGGEKFRNPSDDKTRETTTDEKNNKTALDTIQTMKYDASVDQYGIIDSQRLAKTGYTSTNKWHANSVNGVLLGANNGIYTKTQDIAEAAGILQKLEDGDTDINLYADWSSNTYTVKFDANGGAGNQVTQKMTYDKDTVLAPNSYTRAKHRFLYWTENADGSGKKYTDKANVKNLTATDNGTVTLYAQWEKLTDLKIMNTVSGNMGNRAKDFQFSTAFPACFQNRTFTVIKGDGTKETVTIGADGAVKFSLKHGETFTFTDLDPEQINAIKNLGNRDISESDYTAEGYRTTYAASTEDDGTLRVDFNNAKNSGVPTGLHLGDASLWMTIMGVLGIIGIAISSFLKKKE